MGVVAGEWLVRCGEETALGGEGDSLPVFLKDGCGGFEVAEAGVGLFVGEFDARGERHVRLVEVDLLVGDFDHLVFGHAGGEDGTELLVVEQRQCSA